MKLRRLGIYLLVAPLAAACAGSGSTTTQPPASTEVAVAARGKLAKGVEGTCRVLHGEDGKDYSFVSSAIDAKFQDGERVCFTGAPAMGFCMQGTQVELQTMEACR